MAIPPVGPLVPPAARWRRGRVASPSLATRLVNRTHSELSCLVLTESVAVLGGAQDAEAELDAREILDQRAVILARVPCAQPLEQLIVDLNTSRGHTTSLGAARPTPAAPSRATSSGRVEASRGAAPDEASPDVRGEGLRA